MFYVTFLFIFVLKQFITAREEIEINFYNC